LRTEKTPNRETPVLMRLFPWKFLLRLAARRFDIIDPLLVAARIRSFAQPSEVQEPLELLRAGIIFHARGLLNTKAIQHNLDWVWPYWVERQFNPRDHSFIPRAFSFSHINLTHRNWTALGVPDLPLYPLVDPRGLVTPLHDSWSIDCWFQDDGGISLCPSRMAEVDQKLIDDHRRQVITRSAAKGIVLTTEAVMTVDDGQPMLQLDALAESANSGWLVIALRPCNPEGVQFIEHAEVLEDHQGWLVNGQIEVRLTEPPQKYLFSDYRSGDVFFRLKEPQSVVSKSCRIGMVTAAACYRIEQGTPPKKYPLSISLAPPESPPQIDRQNWPEAELPAAGIQIPDPWAQFLYRTATRSLIHLSAGEVIPGPYTYNRFWFRDACYMLNAMLTIGLSSRCRRHLDSFADRQSSAGFFHSQDGEWDSNGQVLWLFNRYRLLSGGDFNRDWLEPIRKGAEWIAKKRVFSTTDPKINGLLPPGFSAEHFGPNDHYYWDDFWAVAGLHAAAETMTALGFAKESAAIGATARAMEQDLLHSIALVAGETGFTAIPASPHRRLDSAAIGCLVADYPLQLLPPGDARMVATAEYLVANCLVKGCFFQDMIHSGINIYMTLELAETYLRAGDLRFRGLFEGAAAHASPTGQWPEAIHPRTGGGCMGDGQHGWAIAEWLMLLRNFFVMEEEGALRIGLGILPEWLETGRQLAYGPTLTPFGSISVAIKGQKETARVSLTADWSGDVRPAVTACLPGCAHKRLEPPDYSAIVERKP
jgi:hypothetical protein